MGKTKKNSTQEIGEQKNSKILSFLASTNKPQKASVIARAVSAKYTNQDINRNLNKLEKPKFKIELILKIENTTIKRGRPPKGKPPSLNAEKRKKYKDKLKKAKKPRGRPTKYYTLNQEKWREISEFIGVEVEEIEKKFILYLYHFSDSPEGIANIFSKTPLLCNKDVCSQIIKELIAEKIVIKVNKEETWRKAGYTINPKFLYELFPNEYKQIREEFVNYKYSKNLLKFIEILSDKKMVLNNLNKIKKIDEILYLGYFSNVVREFYLAYYYYTYKSKSGTTDFDVFYGFESLKYLDIKRKGQEFEKIVKSKNPSTDDALTDAEWIAADILSYFDNALFYYLLVARGLLHRDTQGVLCHLTADKIQDITTNEFSY